jgi:hypothetical protein
MCTVARKLLGQASARLAATTKLTVFDTGKLDDEETVYSVEGPFIHMRVARVDSACEHAIAAIAAPLMTNHHRTPAVRSSTAREDVCQICATTRPWRQVIM